MSYVIDLLAAYERFVELPWPRNLSTKERVWMAIYPPEQERRVRLHLPEFRAATERHGHPWSQIDVSNSFEEWMAEHPYRDSYFRDPELLETALPAFSDRLKSTLRSHLASDTDETAVVALLGVGTLFGLGASVRVSGLLSSVSDQILGSLLVFFPGENEGNNYRLLDARDGWNYLAVAITPDGSNR